MNQTRETGEALEAFATKIERVLRVIALVVPTLFGAQLIETIVAGRFSFGAVAGTLLTLAWWAYMLAIAYGGAKLLHGFGAGLIALAELTDASRR